MATKDDLDVLAGVLRDEPVARAGEDAQEQHDAEGRIREMRRTYQRFPARSATRHGAGEAIGNVSASRAASGASTDRERKGEKPNASGRGCGLWVDAASTMGSGPRTATGTTLRTARRGSKATTGSSGLESELSAWTRSVSL
jgi:hypothetical protein